VRRLVLPALLLLACANVRAEDLDATPAPRVQPAAIEGVRRLKDLEYGRAGDRRLLLDLYLPERKEKDPPVPVVVWLHGGAWVKGSKSFCPLVKLVPRGYAVASVGYRLATVAPFPAQIDDVRAAIRWLRASSSEHGFDADRFGVVGASAGGHLASLLGTADDPGAKGAPSSRVQAVVDLFGPSDLVELTGEGRLPTPVDTLLGGRVRDNREKAVAASPITHVSRDDPPFLILHGDLDWLVPLRQSERLEERLREEGVEAKLHVVRGGGHGFGGPEIDALVLTFLERHLRPPPEAAKPAPPEAAKPAPPEAAKPPPTPSPAPSR
jgi:acetyl esterase/lipase